MFLIYLSETRRSPKFRYYDSKGNGHQFVWSEPHKLMLLDGRELTVDEFEKLAPGIFGADPEINGGARPVPRFLGAGESVMTLPRFSGGELMKIASKIGELSIENGELRKLGSRPIEVPGAVKLPMVVLSEETVEVLKQDPAPAVAHRSAPPTEGIYDPDDAPVYDTATM